MIKRVQKQYQLALLLVFFTASQSSMAQPSAVSFWAGEMNKLNWQSSIIRPGDLIADTHFASYYREEKIHFSVYNRSSTKKCFHNSAPWYIQDMKGNRIFTPDALMAITCIAPQESYTWVWNQKLNDGSHITPGYYTFKFRGVSDLQFNIKLDQGSSGYFTFNVIGENTRVFMNDPISIRDATDNFYGLNKKNIVTGIIVDNRPESSPYDSRWSWHMDPDTVMMTGSAIEICDALPSYIEDNLDDWLHSPGTWCPWNAKVVALE